MDRTDFTLTGHAGALIGRRWSGTTPSYAVILLHGYCEHAGRYDAAAARLVADGATVYGPDLAGHGRSAGERACVADFEPFVEDVHLVEELARAENPGVPIVVIGHAMGAMIASRYAQRFDDGLACVVLASPVLGTWGIVDELLAHPDDARPAVDPSTLSRAPAAVAAFAEDPLVWHGPAPRSTLLAFQSFVDTVLNSGAPRVPVLWMHGTDDRLVPLEGTRLGWRSYGAAKGRAKIYPGARHALFHDVNADDVLSDVIVFIHRHLT